jgi:protein-S-isoprenylcysteine O-methyltransferase Ste14
MTGIRGWGWLTFGAVIVVLCLLLVRTILADEVRVPELRVSDPVLYMGLGGVELLGCLLFWVENPAVTIGPTTIGPGTGWYLALVAAAATVAGGRQMRGQRRPPEQLDLFDRSKSTSPG